MRPDGVEEALTTSGSAVLGDALDWTAPSGRRVEFGDGSADKEASGVLAKCLGGGSVGIHEAPRVIDYYDCVARGIEERRDGLRVSYHVSTTLDDSNGVQATVFPAKQTSFELFQEYIRAITVPAVCSTVSPIAQSPDGRHLGPSRWGRA